MDRRQYLRALGTGAVISTTGLAGCGAPSNEETDNEGGAVGTDTGTETEDEATAGDGSTETESSMANETGTSGETGTENGTAESTDGQTTTGNGTTTGSAGGTQQAPSEVAMLTEGSNYLFDPVGLHVEPGDTVTWVIESGAHSSTAYTTENPQSEVRRIPEGAEGWNSGTVSEQGTEFTHTFEVEGTYDYYCIPHKTLGMVGRIVVGEPSGLDGDPPDGPVPSEQQIVEQGAVTQDEFNP